MGSVGQRALKLLTVKVGGLKKKSADSAITAKACATVIGPDSSGTVVKSFSKFDGRLFCSPMTYRSQIFSIERSKPFKKAVKSSRC